MGVWWVQLGCYNQVVTDGAAIHRFEKPSHNTVKDTPSGETVWSISGGSKTIRGVWKIGDSSSTVLITWL
ncbi:hypothetical protein TNCT_587141 [Trichonephila clavata]|uniref:Uncharacterized protein n=1 Tax=Trichonephila clavata TaxID=2740835 RepID=A0A8X6HF63_TRICU|nr:hypothetical protein TNCT_587141 [Trichonephila clavata]